MQDFETARDGAEAVARFAAALKGRAPHRIHARWDGGDGIAALSAVEAAIDATWSAMTRKELVWMTGAGAAGGEVLHLRASGADGRGLGAAAYRVADASRCSETKGGGRVAA